MKATAEKTEAVVKEVTLQGVADKREILEAYFQKKIWGKREHNFANGAKTAAEAALRPQRAGSSEDTAAFEARGQSRPGDPRAPRVAGGGRRRIGGGEKLGI